MTPAPTPTSAVGRAQSAGTGAVRALIRRLGRTSLPGASAALVVVAVLFAELAHLAIGALQGTPFGLRFALEVAAVTVIVAAPLALLAQIALSRYAEARRSLRQMTERLALAVDGAEQANRVKTQFLANLSHELRTPLNAIIGFADLIQAQKLGRIGQERYLDYVKDISQSGHHLLRIINDILDLAKIEAGGADTRDEEEFNLAAVIDATLRMMRPLAERQNVSLEIAGDTRGMRLLAVERMICQILLNLLSNAVKFTPAGGRVSLTATRSADGGIVLAVADTGLGMSPDEINIALTPFGQVENALSRKQAGTGLGLPLAKAMMEMHGGTLLVSSAPGKGTTVSLAFPPARVVGRVAPVPRMAAAANAEAPATPRIEDESPLLRPNANRAA